MVDLSKIFNISSKQELDEKLFRLKNVLKVYFKPSRKYFVFLKFMFSKKTTKIEKIFTVDLTHKRQIDGEDLVNFCGLFRKLELYKILFCLFG